MKPTLKKMVRLTTNIDIADRLINGQMGMGTALKIHVNKIAQKPTVIYVKNRRRVNKKRW